MQYFRRTGTNQVNVDFRGAGTPDTWASLSVQSNVNWTASPGAWAPSIPAPGSEWASMRVDQSGFTSTSVTRDNRVYAPVTTTACNEATRLLGPNHTMNFGTAPIPYINPANGFADGVRAVVVSWNNNHPDNPAGTGGAADPQQLLIIQYAPILRSIGTSLPVAPAHIPYTANTYTFTASTNLQGRGIMAFAAPQAKAPAPRSTPSRCRKITASP